jgi:hypothetical protein
MAVIPVPDTLDLYVFRFRTLGNHWAAAKGWLAGIAGPYRRSEQPGLLGGRRATFSRMEPWNLRDVQGHVEAHLVYIKEMAQLHEVAPGEIRVEPGQQPAQKSTGKRITNDVASLDQVLWSRLAKAWAKVEYVEGIILDQVDRGFTVDLGGAVAFLPASQVDIRPSPDVTRLKNVPQTFQILKMDRERGTILVSRRTVLEAIRCERMRQLEEGQVVEGVLDNISDYGAFIDLGGGVIGQLPTPENTTALRKKTVL